MSERAGTTDPEKLKANLEKIEVLTARLSAALAKRRQENPDLEGPGMDLYVKAASAYLTDMMTYPEKLIEQQMHMWRGTLLNLSEAMKGPEQNSAGSDKAPSSRPDPRFRNPLWQTHPYFNFLKQQYLLSSDTLTKSIEGLSELGEDDQQRVAFFARQFVDLMSPTNFLATNPDAIEKALETNGQSLVEGLENFVRDVEANQGDFSVTLSDPNAFEVGRNIATTPGEVIYRNRLFELIRYTPTTEQVHAVPLLIVPPWINKYYILDLAAKNSFIKFAVDQGLSVFVVSWVNPDESYRDVGFDTYIAEGAIEAIETVKAFTGEKKINAIGYCIGGTLLAATLALMAKRGDHSVKTATFFTTLVDFEEPGNLGVFIDDHFISAIDQELAEKGYLSARRMARTFSFLRANDLVYGPAVRSYLLGEAPPAFDLLYWNSDSTNLPARMAKEYLDYCYRENRLVKGTFEVEGEALNLKDIKIPIFAVATKTDHIAPWKASFSGLRQLSGKKIFVLAESGHIAGIINAPAANKYGYWFNNAPADDLDAWLSAALRQDGSWWPFWGEWIAAESGKKIAANSLENSEFPALCPAPGSYVGMRAK
ncbi:MAG: class I poly(R)-hydroxyalkanoic acid synthase [Hyphomicrobiaceae bacterium]|nr:class I poly(R)-hydroxyalkanoic acid synthase [Hyphomicrobiaceae bacterium]MCC0022894.1 class I poly(R)-hydroxyalkanoic acid synthase [Hyphomicrobiaceae bacterium]